MAVLQFQASQVLDCTGALTRVASMKIVKWGKFFSRLLMSSLEHCLSMPLGSCGTLKSIMYSPDLTLIASARQCLSADDATYVSAPKSMMFFRALSGAHMNNKRVNKH